MDTVLVIAPISAILLHETLFRRVEIDHRALLLIATATAAYWLLVYCAGLVFASATAAVFLGALVGHVLLYRAFFHPLRQYPGPFGAKLSKWWAVKQVWDSDWRWMMVQKQLHQKYGDYVRTGPRELSIVDPAAIQPILGYASKTSKGPFYDFWDTSLHLTRDKIFHRQRRKIWDSAMKDSLADYAPRIEEFTSQLLERLRKDDGKPVPLLEYCVHYSYDVMSILAFGKPMGFLTGQSSEAADYILQILTESLTAVGLLYHVPWFMKAMGMLSSLAGPFKRWADWSQRELNERMSFKNAPPDLMKHLLDNTPRDSSGLTLLYGESRLIVGAGSETTSTALTLIFIQLALHPQYMHAVRQEYRENEKEYSCLRPTPLLAAVIHESMRIWPSVFFASQRVTPPEGMTINGHYIPGNMIIAVPTFVLHRDERNFVRPDEFIPERWTTRPELLLNKRAFLPFSAGAYDCVGKGLANMELRSVVSRVVNEFDILLPEGFDAEAYFGGIKDHFTAGLPRQMVKFVRIMN